MVSPRTVAVLSLVFAAGAGLVRAHHDWPADRSAPVTIQGTVTAFTWANPHVTIAIEVASNGAAEKWILGASSPKNLSDNGWDKATLKPGDVITAIGYRFRNGSNVLQIQKIILASGRELYYAGPPRR
jgi:hypothetical protein